MIYDVGDIVELEAVAKITKSGEPAEGTPTFTVRAPDGTVSHPTPTSNSGTYTAKVEIDKSGKWRWAFDLSGANKGSEERTFEVRRRQVPRT